MKELKINAQNILIQENLDNYRHFTNNRYKNYLNNNYDKKVITIEYNGHLIAIDGNKLCTIGRLLKKNIDIIILETEKDFQEFFDKYDKDIYNSFLLNYKKFLKFKKDHLEFFEQTHKNINLKDFFSSEDKREEFIKNSAYSSNDLIYKKIQGTIK